MPSPLMTLREAADFLATSHKTVERRIELGEIEAVQVGSQRKPVRESVIAYYNRQKVRPSRVNCTPEPPTRRGPVVPKQREPEE